MQPDFDAAGAGLRAPGPLLLQMKGVSKRYPGVVALDHVELALHAGSIHALAGENGAGKSSLIRVLSGSTAPDGGSMLLAGMPYRPRSPFDAIHSGIRVVHQELLMLEHLTVAENLQFAALPRTRWGWIDRRTLNRRASELLALVGLEDVAPTQSVHTLGIAQRQLIEIAKALSGESRIIVLDEPTATLTARESARLLELMVRLRERGVAMLLVSHHLQELFAVCDRVTVLRNGRTVATHAMADVTPHTLVQLMAGREVPALPARVQVCTVTAPRPPALSVEGLRFRAQAPGKSIRLAVQRGEIVGIAGLVGSGRTETLRAIAGADPMAAGRLLRDGQPVTVARPADAIAHGICLVTEDRRHEGLMLDLPLRANLSLATLGDYARAGWLQRGREAAAAAAMGRALQIRMSSIEQTPRTLSGGNQQKVVLGKWLLRDPAVLLLDEPTRGVDVVARAEIHRLLLTAAGEGKALLVASSDLAELMEIADRIIVLSRGAVAGEVARADFDETRILALAYSELMNTGVADVATL
ncbi:ATP-binding cassette domain-containing protein [Pseudoduganella sp. FT93W]|uniref:ATP-binding cassette domain-containing protein n=1 Tax=Duganella fentianensis TaxID=2692177 RepID=A0A845I224_9BURK|nr:sugar ABC transporter ATP-binding protein [Duganella fentianensis]MYN47192.1 ATP-binding cassette domain-containing protein [Duganella fentianensis]